LESSLGYYGVNGTLYPAFSDLPTQERFRATGVDPSEDEIAKRRQEADEVAWWLGVLMSIQIVPAAGGSVLHVLAGTPESVHRRGNALCREAWSCAVPRRAELVVAAIEGDRGQQSWENVGRALAAASRAVTDDGAIALCTELADGPGPALRWLGRSKDLPSAIRHIRKQRTSDAGAANELARALERVQVYLLSRLDESVVEELGVAPVTAAAEIARLASRHRSCILLANAQFASPTAAGD
jgi:nickel-dependent lactate racemase